jgi:1-acyl-sn-glycerol-3-phosphate acyltransferase
MVEFARAFLRCLIYPALVFVVWLDLVFSGARRSLRQRVAWLQRTARRHARWMGLVVRVHGPVPNSGLIVANHVSYLDILGLSMAASAAFVAKKQIERWPHFGGYARAGGTIFVERERRGAVATVAEQMRGHLDQGVPVVLFPEGTSTDGTGVLPFRTSLFEPVIALDAPLTACGLRYSATGDVATEVAYWGDLTLLPHMFGLLGKRHVYVDLYFGPSSIRSGDRKTIAKVLHAEVCALAASGPMTGDLSRFH